MEKTGVSKKRVNNETKAIGRNLVRLRYSYGATQRQVAEVIQTSFQQVQKYEKGQNRIPAEKLHRLKQFFGVPYDVFFEGLPNAGQANIDDSEQSAKILYLKIKNLKDENFRLKLFRAFMILAS